MEASRSSGRGSSVKRELHVFGPAFGLPDPSPFCMKAQALLQMAQLPFELIEGDVTKAPKKKFPVLVENGTPIPDTTLIRFHVETNYGVDFDDGLDAAQRAQAWAFEKLCEDNLYWIGMHERWVNKSNFDRGPRMFFDSVPAPLRPIIVSVVRREVKRNLHGQGLGRHSDAERTSIGKRSIDALADFLGNKPWLMGDRPCGADTFISSMITGILCPLFDSEIGPHVAQHDNLVAYSDRALAEWFPDHQRAAVA